MTHDAPTPAFGTDATPLSHPAGASIGARGGGGGGGHLWDGLPRDVGGDQMAAALACYRDESLFVRLFTRGRHWLAPMRAVARWVPAECSVLDVGCGYGLFVNLLAAGSPRRRIVGVEPNDDRLVVARRASSRFPNVRYITGMLGDVTDGPFDVVTILDVLYLLPDDLKLEVLKTGRRLVTDGGVFLLKTNDTRPLWKYAVVRMEEWLMVKALAFTFGGQIHFRGEREYLDLLKRAGFEAQVYKVDGFRPVPHRLYVCRPT